MTVAELQDPSQTFRFDFNSLAIPEEALRPIRRNLYHSSGQGYHVFRNFLGPELAAHIQRFWSELEPTQLHRRLPAVGVKALVNGCPDYFYGDSQGDRGYLNFFWNYPADEVSYAVAMQVQWLRNRVMGRTPHEDIFPLRGRALGYRTVISRRGQVVTRPHRDFDGDEWRREPFRLQATLFLSTPGVDFTGDGFILETNQGRQVTFGGDVPIASGDLVLWRYCNQHSVLNVESTDDQCGFIRMLFPVEEVPNGRVPVEPVAAPPRPPIRHVLLRRLKASPLGHYVLVPLWHRIRRR
jgi:hypothetical protein